MFWSEARSPFAFGSALITAASWHLAGDPPFGGGSVGFAKSYAAAVGQKETGLLLGKWAFPVILDEDPRYYPAPKGAGTFHRAMYAASRVVITRSDDNRQTWNGAYILGGLGSAGIANLYMRRRDSERIFTDFAVGMGTDAGMNVLKEFWPSVRPKIPGKKMKKLGDVVLGLQ